MSLLPSKPDTSAADEDADPRVIGVDSDEADDVIAALSSETARKLLAELHEEPAPPSELSDRVDTSLQNAQYHLQKLEAAGAVSVVDTAYSAKGREMDVYAPSDQPLVIFAGDEEKTTGLKAALSRLLGGAGLLALGSVVVQTLYGGQAVDPAPTGGTGTSGGNGGDGGSSMASGATASNDTTKGVSDTVTSVAETTSSGDGVGTFDVGGGAERTAENGTEYTLEMTNTTLGNGSNVTLQDGATTSVADTVTTTATEGAGAAATTAGDSAVQATEAAAGVGVPPGLLFFAGGALVLALWLAVWYVRE